MMNVKQKDYSVKMNVADKAMDRQAGNDGLLPLPESIISEKRPFSRRRHRLEHSFSELRGCCKGSQCQQQRQTALQPSLSATAGTISGEQWAPLWATLVIERASRS